jgi:signal transduction histidine kinase
LRNLIDNALRYNPPGIKPVVVSAKSDDGQLLIRVQDNGAGIPPEHINRVTEPFYRADPARSRATGGVGLGLYLCKRVAEVHGGRLVIESSAGAGTGVTVILPLAGNA